MVSAALAMPRPTKPIPPPLPSLPTLGERLKYARKERACLTLVELSAVCGMSASALSRLETGSAGDLSALNAVALADALDVPIRWLVTGDG